MFEDQTSIDMDILISPCLIDATTLRLLSWGFFSCIIPFCKRKILELFYVPTEKDVYTKLDHKRMTNVDNNLIRETFGLAINL